MTVAVALQEYGKEEVDLDHHAVTALRAAAGRALTVTPTADPGRWVVGASSLVGTVVTPDARVLIRPKVDAANLFHLLEAGGNALDVRRDEFDYGHTGDLVPVFATFFVRHLEQALARGVVRRYDERSDRMPSIRGRVDLRAQVREGGLPLPANCVFDEHSANTQLNRIVAGAIRRLVRFPGVTTPTRRALLHTAGAFEDAEPFTTVDLARPTIFTRLDQHFRPVERLARLVLTSSSLRDTTGTTTAGTFLIDMNKVFETFVEDRLRRYLRSDAEVRGQATTTLDEEGQVRMRPDLLIRRRGVDVYVADAKYKLTADGLGRESDYYQLLAYCTALGLPEGMLIYCQHDGTVPARQATVRNGLRQRLVTYAVRLDGQPHDIDARIRSLADLIRARLEAPAPVPGAA